jgi:hypothetical protein
MGKGEAGSGILYLSAFKNDLCSIYDISTGTVTGNYYTNGQTDSAISYQGNLYVGNYKSGTLVQIDTTNGSAGSASAAQEKNTVLLDMRYTLDKNGEPFNQVRVPAIAAGGNKVFAGTIPNSYLRGGCLGWYDLETGEKYIERHVVENQSILSLAYQNGYLFGTSGTEGGTGAEDDPTLSAKVFIYNVGAKQKVKEIDLRNYISGLPEPALTIQLVDLNEHLITLARNNHVYYLDLDNGLDDEDNTIRNEYVADGLHFNPTGTHALEDYFATHVIRREDYVQKVCQ